MNEPAASIIDSVCGMHLDQDRVEHAISYYDRTYFFCSVGCLAEFQRQPGDYAHPEAQTGDA